MVSTVLTMTAIMKMLTSAQCVCVCANNAGAQQSTSTIFCDTEVYWLAGDFFHPCN